MSRILGICAALVLVLLLAFPFGREAYHRYRISNQLYSVMDERDRAAFREWNADAASFARSLLERCELTQGRGAPNCNQYRFAAQ